MHNEIKDEVLAKMQEIYEKNWFIQGPEVTAFEKKNLPHIAEQSTVSDVEMVWMHCFLH